EDGMITTTDSTGKFSFTNVRPGRHAFRLDPRSIPDGYRLASEDVQLVDASGWTTPRVDFRLVPTGAVAVGATSVTSASPRGERPRDRKSTRLNSSHRTISYAVFCLKKKS